VQTESEIYNKSPAGARVQGTTISNTVIAASVKTEKLAEADARLHGQEEAVRDFGGLGRPCPTAFVRSANSASSSHT
jgi:hypothetical protein